jgi:hypothetical protein
MPGNEYFDSKRDKATIGADGFFCLGCLVGKPAAEQSGDPRYCQSCYDFLAKEAQVLVDSGSRARPKWIPVSPPTLQGRFASQKLVKVSQDVSPIMSTVKEQKTEVDIIKPSVAKVTIGKRGRKPRALPLEVIRELADQGVGPKAIATQLRKEHGAEVSYKTIQRLLTRQRVLV